MQTVLQIGSEVSVRALAPLLGHKALVATGEDQAYWLKINAAGIAFDPQLETAIACIPAVRYELVDSWLIRRDQQVASRRLPDGLTWNSLDDVLEVKLPTAALAASRDQIQPQPLELVRGTSPANATAIVTSLIKLHRWADDASSVRLRQLRWVCRGHDVLVMGEPLPHTPGQYLCARGRALVPAGFEWTPAIPVSALLSVFEVGKAQWLVWETTDRWSVVDDDAFISMRRASVRQRYQQLLLKEPA